MKRLLFVPLLFGLALAAGPWLACSQSRPNDAERADDHGQVTELTNPRSALSEELMVALSLAKNHHHKADVYLKQAEIDNAVTELEHILTIEFPEASPEGEDVVLDARARLAKLLVTQGKLDDAMSIVDQGLAQTSRESFFVANLHTVRGEVFEARAITLDESDAEAAKRDRRDAIRAFDRAIQIDKALLDQIATEGAE